MQNANRVHSFVVVHAGINLRILDNGFHSKHKRADANVCVVEGTALMHNPGFVSVGVLSDVIVYVMNNVL